MTSINKPILPEVTVSHQSPRAERQVALAQIYAQVLERKPYHFEHKILAKDEEDFLKNKIGVKRFLRILGHSEVYLNEFYYTSSNPKFIELCFKHFMGRAPKNKAEMHDYCDILMRRGVKDLITAMLDSEEYRQHFGCFTVPHAWAETTYPSPKTFWETEILLDELHGRRGSVLPTMIWHDLQLDCDGGSCALADTQPDSTSPAKHDHQAPSLSAGMGAIQQVLSTMSQPDLEQFAAKLSPAERDKLWTLLMPSSR